MQAGKKGGRHDGRGGPSDYQRHGGDRGGVIYSLDFFIRLN